MAHEPSGRPHDFRWTLPGHCHILAMMARTESIRILVTADEKARIEKAATAARRTMSDWLRLLAEGEIQRQNRDPEGRRVL